MNRQERKDLRDPSSFTWFWAEGRNRVMFMLAALVFLLAVVLFALLLLPENPQIYLYQADPAEYESFRRLAEAFKVKTGKVVDIRQSADTESLAGVLEETGRPALVAFHGGAGFPAIRDSIMPLPESLAAGLGPYAATGLSGADNLMVIPLAFEPLGLFANQPALAMRGMPEFHTIEQLVARHARYGTFYPGGLVLPGGNDRHLLNFLSALVVSCWGAEACDNLAAAMLQGLTFEEILVLDLKPGHAPWFPAGVEPARPTLGALLDLLVTWARTGCLQPRWYTIPQKELEASISPAAGASYVLPAGFMSRFQARLATGYRFQRFPDLSTLPGYRRTRLSGTTLYLARTIDPATSPGDSELAARADDFFAFVVSDEGRAILASQTGVLVTGLGTGQIPGWLEEVQVARDLTGRIANGLWLDGFDRLAQDRWTADTAAARFSRQIRDYLKTAAAAPAPAPAVPADATPEQ